MYIHTHTHTQCITSWCLYLWIFLFFISYIVTSLLDPSMSVCLSCLCLACLSFSLLSLPPSLPPLSLSLPPSLSLSLSLARSLASLAHVCRTPTAASQSAKSRTVTPRTLKSWTGVCVPVCVSVRVRCVGQGEGGESCHERTHVCWRTVHARERASERKRERENAIECMRMHSAVVAQTAHCWCSGCPEVDCASMTGPNAYQKLT
jgi:hypothetical protein